MTKRSIPPPERRIHGSSPGPALFMRNPKPVSWSTWSLMPHCELWQAVCLSLDFEPPKRLDLVEFLRVPHTTFIDRMKVCIANLGNKLPADNPHMLFFDRAAAQVDLETFAAVAESWAWDIPQALQARAQYSSAPPAAPAAEAVATKPRKKETREERQARRYRQCIDAGLEMPTNDYSPMPRGICAVAKKEGISRQAYVEDVKHHINRTWPRSQ
jgi:hypothetical protein